MILVGVGLGAGGPPVDVASHDRGVEVGHEGASEDRHLLERVLVQDNHVCLRQADRSRSWGDEIPDQVFPGPEELAQ